MPFLVVGFCILAYTASRYMLPGCVGEVTALRLSHTGEGGPFLHVCACELGV